MNSQIQIVIDHVDDIVDATNDPDIEGFTPLLLPYLMLCWILLLVLYAINATLKWARRPRPAKLPRAIVRRLNP